MSKKNVNKKAPPLKQYITNHIKQCSKNFKKKTKTATFLLWFKREAQTTKKNMKHNGNEIIKQNITVSLPQHHPNFSIKQIQNIENNAEKSKNK